MTVPRVNGSIAPFRSGPREFILSRDPSAGTEGVWKPQDMAVLKLIALSPQGYVPEPVLGNVLVHVTEGTIRIAGPSHRLPIYLTKGQFIVLSEMSSRCDMEGCPKAEILTFQLGSAGFQKCDVQVRTISDLPHDPRPIQDIRLWSLLALAGCRIDAGYEYVEINGLVRRHAHQHSATCVYVTEGEGRCGLEIGGDQKVAAVQKGSVIHVPAGVYHGFCGHLNIVSAQVPAIEDDYVFDGTEFRYSEHEQHLGMGNVGMETWSRLPVNS